MDAARRRGGREDSPDRGQLVVHGGEHSRESPVLAHQSGQRPSMRAKRAEVAAKGYEGFVLQ